MNWMLFYREADCIYYFFNGKWPIAVTPNADAWGKEGNNSVQEQIESAEKDVPLLNKILKSKKRVFTKGPVRYIIVQRGIFIEE